MAFEYDVDYAVRTSVKSQHIFLDVCELLPS